MKGSFYPPIEVGRLTIRELTSSSELRLDGRSRMENWVIWLRILPIQGLPLSSGILVMLLQTEITGGCGGLQTVGKGEPGQVAHVGHGTSPARFRNVQIGVMK